MANRSALAFEDGRLATSLKVGWGLGSVGTQIILNGQSLLLLYYFVDRKSTRLNSSHRNTSRMPSSA